MSAPTARMSDPATSHDAARDAARTAPTVRQRCLDALRSVGDIGATDHELAEMVGRQQTSAGVRRKELERAGLVCVALAPDGTPLRRRTPSGSSALVWVAVA